MNELLVHEVLVLQPLDFVVDDLVNIVIRKPVFPQVGLLLVEAKVDRLIVLPVAVNKLNLVHVQLLEVLERLLVRGGTETFVILDLPGGEILPLRPDLEVLHREKALHAVALDALQQRGHKLLQKPVNLDEGGPKMVDKVDDEALDVGAVLVLVGHDHQPAVAQALQVCVLLPDLEPEDFDQVLDLLVLENLLVGGLPHVQQLALQGEHPVVVPPDGLDPGHGQRFRAVTFGDD